MMGQEDGTLMKKLMKSLMLIFSIISFRRMYQSGSVETIKSIPGYL